MDRSRRPVRPAEWAAVLDAVYHAQSSDEQTWLEWKSTLDLRSKEQMATIVAKAIIALANRDPGEAAAHVGGIGILLIGIEPGNVPGVTQVDNADLDQMLTNYLGTDGPEWQPHWDQYQGKIILIIEVSPPAWGDPPHCFRKAFGSIPDGATYVRHLARSVPADHRQVRRLTERYANRPADNTLDIAVGVDYRTALSRYTWSEADLDTFIEAERARLLKPVSEPAPCHGPHDFGQYWADAEHKRRWFSTDPETRMVEEYESEVEQYLRQVRASWPEMMRSVAAHLFHPTIFTVTNLSARNYRQLEVKLYFGSDVDVVSWQGFPSSLRLRELLPSEPLKWGPRERDYLSEIPLPGEHFLSEPSGKTMLDRGGVLTLTDRPLDLRPRQTEFLDNLNVVLIPAARTDDVIVSWSATATNVDATAEGQFTLALEGPVVDLMKAESAAQALAKHFAYGDSSD